MTLLGLPPGVGPELGDAQSPPGRAGSEGICSQGGGLVELSTWSRAISVLCSEMTSWVSQGAWGSPFHHATQGTEPSSCFSDPPKPREWRWLEKEPKAQTILRDIQGQHHISGCPPWPALPSPGSFQWAATPNYRQVALEPAGVGVGPRLTTVGRNPCTLLPASAGPSPALVAYHPSLLQDIQDRSTLPPRQRNSRALQLLRFLRSRSV